MGKLLYGSAIEVAFNDRTLAHLQLVITAKLKRRECFVFSWQDKDDGDGRTVVWIDPGIPLVFRYENNHMPTVNRDWLEQLTMSANSSQGLMLSDEHTLNVGLGT